MTFQFNNKHLYIHTHTHAHTHQTSNKEWVNEYTVPALYGTYTVARGHRSSSRPRATWIRHDVEGSERNHATMWTQGVGRKSNVEKLVGEALCETNA